ncbi:MAG: 4-oxalomesaconate tautomerase [Proteobacteria bacterium]|nr:4-oxalomesaconate tautomerase [Pseudomonadota bacterium]MDA0992197.1 4-oxalomesaconate tautomerase [Pseudomonadota bacterium]
MQSRQTTIACSVIRGGTSRGIYFLARNLPADETLRDRVLTAVMGGPDALQVNGIGGGHPLTSKVAIVGSASVADADVDYLFLQVAPDNSYVSAAQNCGNILAGVGPFAIENNLVRPGNEYTTVRVHMVNSGNRCELTVKTPGGVVEYDGATVIDGVPGSAAAVICDFQEIAGSMTGALLPTGNVVDDIDGMFVTCIDNGMPVVLIRAADLGCSGYETPEELDRDVSLKKTVESLRLKLGPMMNLGDVEKKSVPKMCLVAAPVDGGNISSRTFIPHDCHRSIGVLGAVTVATACLIPGTVAEKIATVPAGEEKMLSVEHPSGAFQVRLVVDESAIAEKIVSKAGVVRTARLLMRGDVFIPRQVWDGTTGVT